MQDTAPKKSPYETDRTGGDGRGTGRVKPQDIALLHQRIFENLSYFHEFCEKHGLHYVIGAGSCIGAVREHDFIPWDDDLDVALLREDFEKLFECWEKDGDKERFSLYRTTDDFCAFVPIALLRNQNTTWVREHEAGLTDRCLGVKIDVQPLDEIPANPIKRKIQRFFAYPYILFLTQRPPKLKQSKLRQIGCSILLFLVRSKRIRNWIIHFTGRQVRKYNGTGCEEVALNGFGGARKRSDILHPTKILFHGATFNIPGEYDPYLRRHYGDYMVRPPVEKRLPLDQPVFYDLNLPSREYIARHS